ncbi:hypothetical protein IGI04_010540 [Brassica rapa subsp. trilocularis]|uniref:Uncharacterized protein n=1 Tax=Brassica rapa subsp. trilocularis TaxID=1813537 RepID=A0ABQ7N2P1_BRACM|nr:hypothetical protein IGI04_010540 [Brassica rapa subsp. trilocularis]
MAICSSSSHVFWFKCENASAENLLKTNSIDSTVQEEVMFRSEVKKLQLKQFRPAEQVSLSSQEMLQYIVFE